MKNQALVLSSSVQYHDMDVPVYEIENDYYLSGQDLGKILGMANPADSIRVLFNRHREELEPVTQLRVVIRPSSSREGRGGGSQKVRLYKEK